MLKKVALILLPTLLLMFFNQQSKVPAFAADKKLPTQEMEVQSKALDPRAVVLRDYFAKYNSPLQDYSQDFIDASDQYNVDWRLVPAISGVESTFGQNSAGGYNDWGWGVYGDQAIYFGSQKEAIYTVTKGLRENYINKGLTTPYQINYDYASSPYWGWKVDYFMADIERFSQDYNLPVSKLSLDKSLPGQSDNSAQLALK